MDQNQLNWITNFIWNIADDELRDVYVRGKYRDVILPMTVIRRLDAVLEPTKQDVLKMKEMLDKEGITDQHGALIKASGKAFYNTSPYTLRDLRARAKQQQLKADFEAYLDGFSPNVKEILQKFEFHNQIAKLARADLIGNLLEKFLDPRINLSDKPVLNADGGVRLEALDNHGMGTIFEELLRMFNEENNEEAGEHFTPRDVIDLMAKLIFLPITDKIESSTYLLYDGACGTGGMLTLAEETLRKLANDHGKEVSIHLYGQEINPETYAICKADLLLKGEGSDVDHIVGGEEMSTLSNDAFPSLRFDFMLSNPPYGKSWKTDLERMGGKGGIKDPRFLVEHADDAEYKMITRSSEGQMMFLVNMLSKMKHDTPLGSRIAEVHNGSSLFTGDAGQGESNIRRWIIENDWLEVIIALPLNMFHNTGIATYIWVLSNRKSPERRGKVQLIDATEWSTPRRKNLGQKNCDLSPANIKNIIDAYLAFQETEKSKIFRGETFGYWKITVERPLRMRSQFTRKAVEGLRFATGDEELRRMIFDKFDQELYENFTSLKPKIEQLLDEQFKGESEEEEEGTATPKLPEKRLKKLLDENTWMRDAHLYETAQTLMQEIGEDLFPDHNRFREEVEVALKKHKIKFSASDRKAVLKAVSWHEDDAPAVILKIHKAGTAADPLHGLFETKVDGKACVVEYEPDPDLRDTEQVPLLEDGGVEAFFQREIIYYVPDAWIDEKATKKGYEISFARIFYKPEPLETLDEIRKKFMDLNIETENVLEKILGEEI